MKTTQFQNLEKLRKQLITNEKRKYAEKIDIAINEITQSFEDKNVIYRQKVHNAIMDYDAEVNNINTAINELIEKVKQNNS